MSRIAAASLALALLGVVATGAAAAAPLKPAMQVVTAQPLVIHGSGFKRLEVVRVTVFAGDDRATRRVLARRGGAFTARFGAIAYDRCNELLVVRAIGSKGSAALLKIPIGVCPNP